MQEYEDWVQGYVAAGGGCPAAQLPPETQVCLGQQLFLLQLSFFTRSTAGMYN
jgi:hypothetical protein